MDNDADAEKVEAREGMERAEPDIETDEERVPQGLGECDAVAHVDTDAVVVGELDTARESV